MIEFDRREKFWLLFVHWHWPHTKGTHEKKSEPFSSDLQYSYLFAYFYPSFIILFYCWSVLLCCAVQRQFWLIIIDFNIGWNITNHSVAPPRQPIPSIFFTLQSIHHNKTLKLYGTPICCLFFLYYFYHYFMLFFLSFLFLLPVLLTLMAKLC